MRNLDQLLPDILLDDFWRAIDDLDDVIDGKEYKKLIKEYFGLDGKSKKKREHLQIDEQLQDWNEINNFVTGNLRARLLKQKTRDHVEQRKAEIREKKEVNRVRHQLARGGGSVEKS